MPKRRHHSGICEQSDSPLFFEVENNRSFGGVSAHKRHQTIGTCVGFAHDAGIAADDEYG
jgi:hypothetical protein